MEQWRHMVRTAPVSSSRSRLDPSAESRRAIGAIALCGMQVANIISTGNVERAVDSNHRELVDEAQDLAKDTQQQTEILKAIRDLEKAQSRVIEQIQKGQNEKFEVLLNKLEELKQKENK